MFTSSMSRLKREFEGYYEYTASWKSLQTCEVFSTKTRKMYGSGLEVNLTK